MDNSVRKESSIPVQGRISIVDLARMDAYWAINEGVNIRTMSQLVSWTFSAMCDIIEANGKMPGNIESVEDAHKYLQAKGLYQQSMKKRGRGRISAALGFETLRKGGLDPAQYSSNAYNTIHSKHSIETFDGQVSTGGARGEKLDKMVKIFEGLGNDNEEKPEQVENVATIDWDKEIERGKEEGEKERIEEIEKAKETMTVVPNVSEASIKEGMSDEELLKDREEKDKRRAEMENAPVRSEDFELIREV